MTLRNILMLVAVVGAAQLPGAARAQRLAVEKDAINRVVVEAGTMNAVSVAVPVVRETAPKSDATLSEIESRLSEIENNPKAMRPTDEVVTLLNRYKEEVTQEFQSITAAFQAEGDRKPGRESPAAKRLASFEERIRFHVPRTVQINERAVAMIDGLVSGRMVLDPEFIRKMTIEQVDDFKNSVSPEARKAYESIDPRFAMTGPAPAGRTMSLRCQSADLTKLAQGKASAMRKALDHRSFFEKAYELLVPRAEAAIALSCVPPCFWGGTWNPWCRSCLATAAVQSANAYASANAQINACTENGSFGWWFSPYRVACVSAAIASLTVALA